MAAPTDLLRYLSDEWLARAAEAVADLAPLDQALTVDVTVTGGPEGDRRYRMVLGPDRVAIEATGEPAGGTDAPGDQVRMTLDWTDAVTIAQGTRSAQRAFLDGRLRLGGDTGLLLGHQDALARFDDRLAPLRATTRFD